jgi:hypothetical protein
MDCIAGRTIDIQSGRLPGAFGIAARVKDDLEKQLWTKIRFSLRRMRRSSDLGSSANPPTDEGYPASGDAVAGSEPQHTIGLTPFRPTRPYRRWGIDDC